MHINTRQARKYLQQLAQMFSNIATNTRVHIPSLTHLQWHIQPRNWYARIALNKQVSTNRYPCVIVMHVLDTEIDRRDIAGCLFTSLFLSLSLLYPLPFVFPSVPSLHLPRFLLFARVRLSLRSSRQLLIGIREKRWVYLLFRRSVLCSSRTFSYSGYYPNASHSCLRLFTVLTVFYKCTLTNKFFRIIFYFLRGGLSLCVLNRRYI